MGRTPLLRDLASLHKAKKFTDFGAYLQGDVWVRGGRLAQEKKNEHANTGDSGHVIYGMLLFAVLSFLMRTLDGFPLYYEAF